MFRTTAIAAITIALIHTASPGAAAAAVVIHKWVDEHGVTHYSDEPPTAQSAETTKIRIPRVSASTEPSADHYYSIANQWNRMHRERLEREKLRLQAEQARAAAKPEITNVYVNERDPGYRVVYGGYYHKKRYRGHKRPNNRSAYTYRGHQSKYPPGLHPGRHRSIAGSKLKL
jgi:hypothetical protein